MLTVIAMASLLILFATFVTLHCHRTAGAFDLAVDGIISSLESLQGQLEEAVVEAITGPLKDKWVVIIADKETTNLFNIDRVLMSVHFSHVQPLYVLYPQEDWEKHLPQPSVLKGRCAVILLINSWPDWLIESGDEWSPEMLLVVNVNTSVGSRSLLSLPLIQCAPSLALIETTEEWFFPHVYTSHPFLKDEEGHRLIRDFMGNWNSEDFQTRQQLFPDRFKTFGGEVLHVASDLDDYPLIFKNEGSLDGTNIRILNTLSHWLNFTYTTTIYAEDENWGELVNGSWNGLLGEVYRGEKDLTVNYFTIVQKRSKDFYYTSSYLYEGFGLALMIPPPLPPWMGLLYPFTFSVWISVIALLLVITPVLYILAKVSNSEPSVSFQDAALEILSNILLQGSTIASSSDVVRMVLTSWSIVVLILVSCYTSNLIAVLTVPVFPPKITSINGIARSNFRTSMINYGEFVPVALATSQDQDLKTLGDRMDLVYNYEDDEVSYNELIEVLVDGKHAIIETYSYLRNLLAHDERTHGKTYVLKEQIYQGALAFFLAKNTPWKDRLDQGLRRLVEAGLVDKWYRDIMSTTEVALNTHEGTSEQAPLTLSNLQGPFVFLLLGNAIAVLVFSLEGIFHETYKRRMYQLSNLSVGQVDFLLSKKKVYTRSNT